MGPLIEIWRSIIVGDQKSWVLFKNGTCVILIEPEADLSGQAVALMKEWGPVYGGCSAGDFRTITLTNAPGWVVTSHHSDILTYVGPDEVGQPGATDLFVGMLGREKRDLDARELEIIHVEDRRGEPAVEADRGRNARFASLNDIAGSLAVPFAGTTPIDREYDYRPKWGAIILCALFPGICALVLGANANGNVFYWVMAALSIGFVVAAGFLAIMRLMVRQRIALSQSSITVPRSRWSNEELVIPFCEIVELIPSEFSRVRFLNILYNGGIFTLNASLLPRKDDFDEICAAVSQSMEVARSYAR